MTTLRVRFATTNAPESMKKGLLRSRIERARRVARFQRVKKIDVRAIQEAGTYAEQIDATTPLYKTLWATANDFVNGRKVGNGVEVNHWRFKSRLLDEITVGKGDNAIHIPVVLLTHRISGFQFKFYAVHRPTRTAENRALRPVIDEVLREHTKRDDRDGMPWVIAGDMNENPWGWGKELGQHGVDHIRSSRHFHAKGCLAHDRPLLSDHKFLVADALVEV